MGISTSSSMMEKIIGQKSVSAGVASILAGIVAPPLLIPIATVAFFGTCVLTSMGVSTLTDNALDFVRDNIRAAEVRSNLANIDDLKGFNGKSDHGPNRLLLFDEVVKEVPVLESFTQAYPSINTSRLLVKRKYAKAYYTAMESDFTAWKTGQLYTRKFILAGGFTTPEQLKGTVWSETTFVPLQIGE